MNEIENITLSSGWNFYTISLNIDGTYSIMVNDVEVKGGVIENLSRWNVDVDACLVSGGVDFTLFDMGSLFIYNRGLNEDEILRQAQNDKKKRLFGHPLFYSNESYGRLFNVRNVCYLYVSP
mgnify:CR=1 FL=1